MEWGKLSGGGGGGGGGLGREGKQALLKTKENKLRRFCFVCLLCFSSLTGVCVSGGRSKFSFDFPTFLPFKQKYKSFF
jgi:hypothetical protein